MLLKDTRKATERLQEGGVPKEQADAIVDLFVDAEEQVATKTDLEAAKHEIISTVTVRLLATAGALAALLAVFEFAVFEFAV